MNIKEKVACGGPHAGPDYLCWIRINKTGVIYDLGDRFQGARLGDSTGTLYLLQGFIYLKPLADVRVVCERDKELTTWLFDEGEVDFFAEWVNHRLDAEPKSKYLTCHLKEITAEANSSVGYGDKRRLIVNRLTVVAREQKLEWTQYCPRPLLALQSEHTRPLELGG